MNMKEQMADWIAKHPDATIEQAWQAGYFTCTDNWCAGKVALMEKCTELMKQIIG